MPHEVALMDINFIQICLIVFTYFYTLRILDNDDKHTDAGFFESFYVIWCLASNRQVIFIGAMSYNLLSFVLIILAYKWTVFVNILLWILLGTVCVCSLYFPSRNFSKCEEAATCSFYDYLSRREKTFAGAGIYSFALLLVLYLFVVAPNEIL